MYGHREICDPRLCCQECSTEGVQMYTSCWIEFEFWDEGTAVFHLNHKMKFLFQPCFNTITLSGIRFYRYAKRHGLSSIQLLYASHLADSVDHSSYMQYSARSEKGHRDNCHGSTVKLEIKPDLKQRSRNAGLLLLREEHYEAVF